MCIELLLGDCCLEVVPKFFMVHTEPIHNHVWSSLENFHDLEKFKLDLHIGRSIAATKSKKLEIKCT